ncbi:MAG: hypothetical protein ANABAC_2059 [Anaerolineae bacterium]|nr:MAG: hypothetical protein ANABAC_2059 [Anaerolineae bacterium]
MEENIREIILRELPALVTRDPQIREWVWNLIHEYAPSRTEHQSHIEQMLAELRLMREESERKWAENLQKWKENERRWEEQNRKWEENLRRSDAMREEFQKELRALREESERRWQESQKRFEVMREESERKWAESQKQFYALLEKIEKLDHRLDRTIGALGARWGVSSESAFRNALKGILEESFGVKVEQVQYLDEKGEVFGHPDQVELDVIIHNGTLLVCEIKSAASRADVYAFYRKVQSYQKRIGRQADRLLLISPIISEEEKELAQSLGIEVYTDASKVLP